MQLHGITDWLENIQATARNFGQWIGAQVSTKLAQWNADVKKFRDALAAVQMSEGLTPALAARRAALLKDGQGIREKVEWIQAQIGAATSYAQTYGLGVLPVAIPAAIVAAIVAATALIYKFMSETSAYLAEERRYRDLVASGTDPARAREQAQSATRGGGGLFDDVSDALLPLVLIGAAAYVLRGKL